MINGKFGEKLWVLADSLNGYTYEIYIRIYIYIYIYICIYICIYKNQ